MADPNIDFLSSNQNNLMVTGLLDGINTALENVDGKSFRQKLEIKRITIQRKTLDDGSQLLSSQHDVDVKVNGFIESYGMKEFRGLRLLMGIDENEHISSLNPDNNKKQIFKTNFKMSSDGSTNDGGRSNSFFFMTEDNHYMVKTVSDTEMKILLQLLPGYIQHMTQAYNAGTLSMMALLQGVYTFSMKGVAKIHLMVMSNAIMKHEDESEITHKFDLKGSKVNRRSLPSYFSKLSDFFQQDILRNSVLKDLDFIFLMKKSK